MANPTLIKSFTADGAVTKRRIVKPGGADFKVSQATAVTEALVGVAAELDAADTARIDVVLAGTVEVEYGGNVTRGDWLTTDANGKAVAAAPGAGVNNNVIGRALVSGVSGDIGSMLIAPGRIQG
jgi:hypothetical protein